MRKINMFLAGFVWLFLLAGCAAGPSYERTSRVEIYRTEPASADTHMAALCSQLQRDADQASAHRRTEVEEYSSSSAPGGSEYEHKYRESSRYSTTSKDRDDMLELCARLGVGSSVP